jgi:hypothetical protein
MEYAIVAGYGLSSDPFDQEIPKQPAGIDLFWNRFKVKNFSQKRFYADSRDYGEGTEVVKLSADDRGAPAFLEEKTKPLRKLVGIASGSDFNKESYFILLNQKTLSCLVPALTNQQKRPSLGSAYTVFCGP